MLGRNLRLSRKQSGSAAGASAVPAESCGPHPQQAVSGCLRNGYLASGTGFTQNSRSQCYRHRSPKTVPESPRIVVRTGLRQPFTDFYADFGPKVAAQSRSYCLSDCGVSIYATVPRRVLWESGRDFDSGSDWGSHSPSDSPIDPGNDSRSDFRIESTGDSASDSLSESESESSGESTSES
jgi:hypothetical protein